MTGSDDSGHLARGSSDAGDEAAIVLAAGRGTRMRSRLPKVLHSLAGRPMLVRVLDALAGAGFACPLVVAGYGADLIERHVGHRCCLTVQKQQAGTGDAARVGVDVLPDTVERVILAHGDEPLIEPDVYAHMLELQRRTGAAVVLLTAPVQDTRGFGRVVRDHQGAVVGLKQEADLTSEERAIREVNLGAYVFDAAVLRRLLARLEPHPPSGELYLTDVVAMARDAGHAVETVTLERGEDVLGVNDLVQLEQASCTVYQRTNRRLMEQGVRIVDSASTFVDDTVTVEPDTVIEPFCIISGDTHIGSGCHIGPSSRIRSSSIGNDCRVEASTVEEAVVEDRVRIGPYAHLRPGAHVGAGAEIGNYAEIKQSTLGPGSRMHHFSYVGDATVGANVNIGAGTITCNYDGVSKHRTVIEDDAFIGSDTLLRAPVTVGRGATTGAGAVVTRDVPADTVAVGMPARVTQSTRSTSNQPTSSETGREA